MYGEGDSNGDTGFRGNEGKNAFYVDKTAFIKKWWDGLDSVTLITRPRRFGKTLNMSTLEYFFSNKYAGGGDLFENLDIWKDEKFRKLQGTYPVVSLSYDQEQKGLEFVYMLGRENGA